MAISAEAISIEEAARTGKKLNYEEYLRTPQTMQRYEIVDGEVRMSPAPTSDHQWLAFAIAKRLDAYIRQNGLGVVLPAPVDVVIMREPKLKTRQPDVLFLSAARTGITGRKQLLGKPLLDVTPELVVEILSPEEPRSTLAGKMADYAAIGVPELWLVSSEGETVEVLQLKADRYERVGLYGVGDMIRSMILPELKLEVNSIFEEEE